MEPEDTAQIRVGAHVLVQLGSELVTDVEQAILECVKNAYDADSPTCTVKVDTREVGHQSEKGPFSKLSRFLGSTETVEAKLLDGDGAEIDSEHIKGDPEVTRRLDYKGRITIEDGGSGLSSEQLRSSWLLISGSIKRVQQGPKTKTPKGRTPLGDKGLGRLGTMRLGDILLIETARSSSENVSFAQFRWGDVENAIAIDEIPVAVGEKSNPDRFKGTRVSILGLNDLAGWRKPGRLNEIARSLAKLVSPFEATSTFPVSIEIDGVRESLVSMTDDILTRAIAEFSFQWIDDSSDGKRYLVAKAMLRKRLVASEQNEQQRERTQFVFGTDDGKALVEALPRMPRIKGYDRPVFNKDGKWFAKLKRRYSWEDIKHNSRDEIEDPGQFEGRFYFFNFKNISDANDAISGVSARSDFIKSLAGIAVLRDGFRVRSHGDWLDVAAEMTSGSFYGLRVDNTLGYFALTGEKNYALTEKSDREGFVEDAAYRGFLAIAQRCAKFASDALVDTRRSIDDFYAKNRPAQVDHQSAGAIVRNAQREYQDVAKARTTGRRAVETLKSDLKSLKAGKASPGDIERIVQTVDSIDAGLKPGPHETKLDELIEGMRFELESRREQLLSLYESAAVGLSARGAAHEMRTHVTEIRQRLSSVHEFSKKHQFDTQLLPSIRAIRGSCSAIAAAAAQIDPMLPQTRSVRETIKLTEFVETYVNDKTSALSGSGIVIRISARTQSPKVRINRPRLLQVIDNLVRNSVFWLRRSDAEDSEREILIEIMPNGFIVSDTGPGVDPHVENSLFEIFVTTKIDASTGQGIGLFIISQLLALDGCSVSLLPDRNRNNRRYRFAVDLSAVVVEG